MTENPFDDCLCVDPAPAEFLNEPEVLGGGAADDLEDRDDWKLPIDEPRADFDGLPPMTAYTSAQAPPYSMIASRNTVLSSHSPL